MEAKLAKQSEKARSWLGAEWCRRRYYVSGGFIKPIPGEPVDFYDPLEAVTGGKSASAATLAQELAGVDLDDLGAIEGFTSRWGLLGLMGHKLLHVRSS